MDRWEDRCVWESGRTRGQTGNGWLNRFMNGEWVGECLPEQMDIYVAAWANGRIDRDRWVGGLVDGWISSLGHGGWADLEGWGNRDGEG